VQVLEYLARYTHSVAIASSRLVAIDGEHVRFLWKDRAHGGKSRCMRVAEALAKDVPRSDDVVEPCREAQDRFPPCDLGRMKPAGATACSGRRCAPPLMLGVSRTGKVAPLITPGAPPRPR
jgi:hypothetical protein